MKLRAHQSASAIERHLRILSLAALFEGEFNIDWLQDLTNEKASQVFAALDFGLQKKWLIGNSSGYFYFSDLKKHQELRNLHSADERSQLHRRIADLLRNELPPQDPDRIKRIAPHLLFISNDLNGCRLLIERGNLHEKSFQYDDARHCYEKAVKDLKGLAGDEAETLFIQGALQYSKVCMDEIGVDNTLSMIKEAIGLAEAKNMSESKALLEMHAAKNEWIRSRFQIARRHFQKGCALAEESGDPKIQHSAAIFHLFFSYWMGKFREAIQNYELFAPDVENFPKSSVPLLASITAGACYGFCGQPSQGLGMLDAIRLHSQKIGNPYFASHAGIAIGELLTGIQQFDEAKKYLEEALKETKSSHNLFAYVGGLILISYVCHKLNDQKKAYSYFREYAELSQRAQVSMSYGIHFWDIAWAMEEGAFPRYQGLDLQQEIRLALQGGNVFTKGMACKYRALLRKRDGAPAREVTAGLKQAIKYLEESGHQIPLANSRIELAREYLRQGCEKKARELAAPAIEILSSLNEALVPDDIRPLITSLRSGTRLLDEILRLGQELVSIRDTRQLFRNIISSVNRITGAERGAIFLAHRDMPENVVLRAAKNLTAEDITMPAFKASMQMINETFKNGKGVIMDLDARPDAPLSDGPAIRSCICVPMNIRDQIVGVLYHDNRIFRSAFRESDLEILNYFAAQAAIAMDNAQAWKALQDLYDKQQQEKEYYEKQYLENIHFEDFVGKSAGIVNVFAQIEQVADTDATVLILGETGVGKELVARSIHRRSPRRDKPFIRVHCSALPESLISSELFGHEKGAFTGATSRQIGRFELANEGTLFLDEIGDISMEIQVKLLRVLQKGEFERIGGHETLHSNFRLLAATNRDLRKEVQAGRFREDLYYRLNVFPISVPPLRQRREDIPLLTHYFLKIYAVKLRRPLQKITQKEMEKLLHYDWPGNVRELENLIERGLILSRGPDYKVPAMERRQAALHHEGADLTLEAAERSHILKILQQTGGKIAGPGGAAEILAIRPSTLNSRLKKLGLRREAHSFIHGA